MRRASTTSLLFALALAAGSALVAGCGGAPDLHGAFRRIQVHEAVIANRLPAADRCEAQAPCPPLDEVCEAAEAICREADAIDDEDARARCAIARRRCARVEGP